ncbi:hypothetical protein J6590_027317 [Homalodisca vitripennis]|nr:hypothetical protein J6590_027317 [Homalodisca vitripennis]
MPKKTAASVKVLARNVRAGAGDPDLGAVTFQGLHVARARPALSRRCAKVMLPRSFSSKMYNAETCRVPFRPSGAAHWINNVVNIIGSSYSGVHMTPLHTTIRTTRSVRSLCRPHVTEKVTAVCSSHEDVKITESSQSVVHMSPWISLNPLAL